MEKLYMVAVHFVEEGNLRPCWPPREDLSKQLSQGKLEISPADWIPTDPGHEARKDPSDNADQNFQAVGPAVHVMQLNVKGLSAAKCSVRFLIREEKVRFCQIVYIQAWVVVVVSAVRRHPWAARAAGYAAAHALTPGTEPVSLSRRRWPAVARQAVPGAGWPDWWRPGGTRLSAAWRSRARRPGTTGFHRRHSGSSHLHTAVTTTTIFCLSDVCSVQQGYI